MDKCKNLWPCDFIVILLEGIGHISWMSRKTGLQCVLSVNLHVAHGGGRCSEFNKKETAISDRTQFAPIHDNSDASGLLRALQHPRKRAVNSRSLRIWGAMSTLHVFETETRMRICEPASLHYKKSVQTDFKEIQGY